MEPFILHIIIFLTNHGKSRPEDCMPVYSTALFGLIGTFWGWMITTLVENFETEKCREGSVEIGGGKRFVCLPPRAAVTIINAAAWVFAAIKAKDLVTAFVVSLLFTFAIVITLIDLRIRIIPNELVLAVIILGIIFQLVHFGVKNVIVAAFFMVALMSVLILAANILGFEKIGAGDVKLIGAMGLVLGYPDIITALIATSSSMMLYCIVGLLIRRLKRTSMFPFAPFIMFGMTFSLFLITLNL
jgi:leader peptidase (prepilin peptidase)/N-methyltransferase